MVIWYAPADFKILYHINAEAKARGEFLLRQPELAANPLHVDLVRDVDDAGPGLGGAVGEGERLFHSSDDAGADLAHFSTSLAHVRRVGREGQAGADVRLSEVGKISKNLLVCHPPPGNQERHRR